MKSEKGQKLIFFVGMYIILNGIDSSSGMRYSKCMCHLVTKIIIGW